ncbi:MAG TPA: hypothetical protein VN426_12205 [Syntrophomonadaceae bacterium]|nr:hypothetical protein [Syntrophomonadaceae bacterium]
MLIPFSVTLKVIKVLEECDINYFIGGSLGSSLYGIPRATLDADLVSQLDRSKVEQLVEKLKDEFYIDADMIYDAIQHESCFNVIHLSTMFKVDIFVLKNDPYAKEEFSRRKPEIIAETGQIMQIATPEDIILTKLLWYKDGGCVASRQFLDAKGVLKVQRERLDHDYLKHWAKTLGVDDWLEKLYLDVHKKSTEAPF